MLPEAERLRASFRCIRPKAGVFADAFYRILADRHPEIAAHFEGSDMGGQKQRLIQALALVVENAERPDVLRAYLRRLGAQHVRYGANDQHYRGFGDCMIAALRETGADRWTPAFDQAWHEAYAKMANLMRDGAKPGRPAHHRAPAPWARPPPRPAASF